MIEFIKDAYGREIRVGDQVIFKDSYTSNVELGKVVSFTKGENPRVVTRSYAGGDWYDDPYAITVPCLKAEPIL